jgi:hypothetical protein
MIYMKNSSDLHVERGQVPRIPGRSMEISITRSPLKTGSVIFNPLGL